MTGGRGPLVAGDPRRLRAARHSVRGTYGMEQRNPETSDPDLAGIRRRLAGLEERVAALELEVAQRPPTPEVAAEPPVGEPEAHRFPLQRWVALAGRTFVVFGGGYLLRALTDAGSVPAAIGVDLGLAYAAFWLLVADRHARAGRLNSALFHTSAAVIMATGLVIELTLRFRIWASTWSALLLLLLGAVALAIGWRRRTPAVAWIGLSIPAAASLVLLGQAPSAFAAVGVLAGLAGAWGEAIRQWRGLRWAGAVLADMAILGLAWELALGGRAKGSWEVLVLLAAFLGYYLTVGLLFALGRARPDFFSLAQCFFVLVSALPVALWAMAASGPLRWLPVVAPYGAIALFYWLAYREEATTREQETATTHGLALLALGALFLQAGATLPAIALTYVWTVLAVLGAGDALRRGSGISAAHALAFALGTTASSGLLPLATHGLLGAHGAPGPGELDLAAVVSALALLAALGVALGLLGWRAVNPAWALVGLVVGLWIAAGLAVDGVRWALEAAGRGPTPPWLASLRTGVLTLLSGLLSISRWRGRVTAVGWSLYPLLGFTAAKLLFEDLPHGTPASMFVSLTLFGAALLAAARRRSSS